MNLKECLIIATITVMSPVLLFTHKKKGVRIGKKLKKMWNSERPVEILLYGNDTYSLPAISFKNKVYGPNRKTGEVISCMLGEKYCKKRFNSENNLFNHNLKDY